MIILCDALFSALFTATSLLVEVDLAIVAPGSSFET